MARRQQATLPAVPESASHAREMVARLCDLASLVREDLAVIVSELVTNAVRHAGLSAEDEVTLSIAATDNRVRVEVYDGGPGFDRAAVEAAGRSSAGGYGLHIVGLLAARWDVESSRGMVWAELDLPTGASAG